MNIQRKGAKGRSRGIRTSMDGGRYASMDGGGRAMQEQLPRATQEQLPCIHAIVCGEKNRTVAPISAA